MNYPQGSMWRKWDLHVHTPASMEQEYGGDNDTAWDRFLSELEALPSEFKVLGINDYIFIDGYARVLNERKRGRLSNIDLVLPVIELRLDKFGGTASKFSRVNFHVIFSNEISAETIQAQFINALITGYTLSPPYVHLKKKWEALPTRESLTELGALILETVPNDKQDQFQDPLTEGFRNLNFKLDEIQKILQRPYFEGKYLTAVGKTEWWDIKWNDNSIADKKTIINEANMVFTSAATPAECRRSQEALSSARVNCQLLDCSDAHRYSSATYKDRIGKCFTWIKADPTFQGLVHAVKGEYTSRVYLGDLPPKTHLVDNNPTKYIQSVSISKKDDSSLGEQWFQNIELELNSDLVAIIGNRGSGKSALSDTIGLLGNTRNHSYSSFLSPRRFKRKTDNKAKHFVATIYWMNGDKRKVSLDSDLDRSSPERIKYIPQGFFDEICNEIPSGPEGEFDRELKKVIFSHVGFADRLGKTSLDELLEYKTQETYDSIAIVKSEIEKLNREIVELEAKASPKYLQELNNDRNGLEAELQTHEQLKPVEVPEPDTSLQGHMRDISDEITHIKQKQQDVLLRIQEAHNQETKNALLASTAEKALDQIRNFRDQFTRFQSQCSPLLKVIGLAFDDVIALTVGEDPILEKRNDFQRQREQASTQLDVKQASSLTSQLQMLVQRMERLQMELDEPNRLYQAYLRQLSEWEARRNAILGDVYSHGTLAFIDNLLQEAFQIPDLLNAKSEERLELVKRIYGLIHGLAQEYSKLHAGVQEFISEHRIARDHLHLRFDVSVINVDFDKRFFDWIGRNVVGSFYGSDSGMKTLQQILESYDFNTEAGTVEFLDDIVRHLTFDLRSTEPSAVSIENQLREGRSLETLYDYVFGLDYLQPRYILKLGDKELSQLSPGERGVLLLIFYLLVDRSDVPLVIDQPEENLDNQVVFQLLVDCVKEAKERRQIIIVTHNPNLAVVCDAEQVIVCYRDPVQGNRLSYTTGSMENPDIKREVVNILEGTKKAFDNRGDKYNAESRNFWYDN